MINLEEVEHFLSCARAGAYPGASGGERRGFALAQCALANQHNCHMDEEAMRGYLILAEALFGDDADQAIALLESTIPQGKKV